MKVIKTCEQCRKRYKDMKCQAEYLVYGKWVCSDCYMKATEIDAE